MYGDTARRPLHGYEQLPVTAGDNPERRRSEAALAHLALAAAVVVVAWTVVVLLLTDLRLGVGVLLLVAAGGMSVQTVVDAVVQRGSTRSR